MRFHKALGKSSIKKQIFYGPADSKGGEGSAPSAGTIRKCENCALFFQLEFDSLILKTLFFSL